ncbi:MAG TPA: esterase-like activity of phytase family protein [Candidatus Binatia bacterium]
MTVIPLRHKGVALGALGLSAALLVAPLARGEETAGKKAAVAASYTLADLPLAAFQNSKLPGSISNDRKILLGSIGSDLWRGPGDAEGEFWMITDRGPNGQIKVGGENRRTFPVPEFSPAILRVKADAGTIRILDVIPIVTRSGKPVTGMPNSEGRDETPYDYTAQKKLAFNPNGLDTEGLVRTASGAFWVVEEYGPSLLKIDAGGKVLKRYVPRGVRLEGADYEVAPALPAIFGRRKINRGFEGLAMSGDEKTLYLALQSPLLNPDKKTGDASRQTRILAFDVAGEKVTAEYAYRFDAVKEFDPAHGAPDEMKVSSVVWINPGALLVLERTDWVAKIYRVDLGAAVNILGTRWDDPAASPSLEALDITNAGEFTPLVKTLVVDLGRLDGVPEKIEGVAVIDAATIAVANDNDFDIGDFDAGGDNAGKGTKNRILKIALPGPLPLAPPSERQALSLP